MQETNDDQQTALEKLKRGEIAALVYVTGKPAGLFAGIGPDTGLHFLSVPLDQNLVETYLPADLDHGAYPSLVPAGKAVDTIAVGSVMAVSARQPHTDRYARVARFVDAFFAKFPDFLKPQRHPKWREVNLSAQVPGWTRFPRAQELLDQQHRAVAVADLALQAEFGDFLSRNSTSTTGLTGPQEQALFQLFLEWQHSQRAAR